MEINIEKLQEMDLDVDVKTPLKLYNPNGMDHKNKHRVKSIEFDDAFTRIDFIYKASTYYINGGWIQMDRDAYIQPKGSSEKYPLIQAIGIPIAPNKLHFRKQGQYHTYTLVFPALPPDTKSIDIIEKLAPGTYFNFYDVAYSQWITVPHAVDVERSNN